MDILARNKTEPTIDFDQLRIPLVNSRSQVKDNPLFQTIDQLLNLLTKNKQDVDTRIATIASGGSGGGGGGGGSISNEDFVTSADDSATLPNSRQLLGGVAINLDLTVANQLTVNGNGVINRHVPTGVTVTIPDEAFLQSYDYYDVDGTLNVEGDGFLLIIPLI